MSHFYFVSSIIPVHFRIYSHLEISTTGGTISRRPTDARVQCLDRVVNKEQLNRAIHRVKALANPSRLCVRCSSPTAQIQAAAT